MQWKKSLLALPQLKKVSIKRSLTLLEKEIAWLELQTFSDASISGYGVRVYVRVRYVIGVVKCCFLLDKARVAPIKFVSVPRLELAAAVLAAEVTNFVINELDQGCATGGPRATIRPVKPFSVALINTHILPHQSIESSSDSLIRMTIYTSYFFRGLAQ